MIRLVLDANPATLADDETHVRGIKVYESSVCHADTGDPLVSIAARSGGRGVRLTPDQALDLRDWLTEWLEEIA